MTGLASGLRVSALIRRVHAAGGSAAVLVRGDADAGGIAVATAVRGVPGAILERGIGADGRTGLIVALPDSADAPTRAGWFERRRRHDPDLWIVELDIADAERFAAETILDD